MREKKESEELLVDYYEAARESFVAKMKSEDDDRINLKFKIAAFVIRELSHATPWFQDHFLSNIAKDDKRSEIIDEEIIKTENAFYDAVADYLIKMEEQVDYAKNILAPLTEEWDKKDFWKPIVFDAFLIVGIYFTASLGSGIRVQHAWIGKQMERNISPRYLYHMNFGPGSNLPS